MHKASAGIAPSFLYIGQNVLHKEKGNEVGKHLPHQHANLFGHVDIVQRMQIEVFARVLVLKKMRDTTVGTRGFRRSIAASTMRLGIPFRTVGKTKPSRAMTTCVFAITALASLATRSTRDTIACDTNTIEVVGTSRADPAIGIR